ncbi:hypothetical protein A2Z67_00070 [Candidatus Woesebacteria bacterium RBG_13_36_22]|uniref:ShKT domain-containing protein n=1 Tax=Candidatus Woesebacteria bacterium RBG_13_36_22 TaxID=1802478 RepID=A0A1F7X6C1_9BACT|nr:MAG: hypothetical protein A2Z67_00070 [Candidatus Woesebacteria bacterium RBG_13_36_22]
MRCQIVPSISGLPEFVCKYYVDKVCFVSDCKHAKRHHWFSEECQQECGKCKSITNKEDKGIRGKIN